MTVQDTSLEAFESIKHKLTHRCLQVYRCLRIFGDMSDREIAEHLGWEINRVTGRRNDLLNHKDTWGNSLPLVEKKGHKISKYRQRVIVWGLVSKEQQELF